MKRLFIRGAVGCCVAFSAAGATWIVPDVVNTAAPNGTHIASTIRIQNLGIGSTLTLTLIPAMGDAAPAPVSQAILPGQTLVLANPLRNLWGIEDRAAALNIACDQSLTISSSVAQDATAPSPYTGGAAAIRYEDLLVVDESGDVLWLTPAAGAAPFDSVIGVVLATPDASVDVVVYDSSGNEAARSNFSNGPAVVEMPAGSIVPAGLPGARVEFQVDGGRAAGYLRNSDPATGDPWFSLAQTQPSASNFLVAGVPGTAAPMSLRLLNSSPYDIVVTATLYGPSGGPAQATAQIPVAAGQMVENDDVTGGLFNLPGASGTLDLESAVDPAEYSSTYAVPIVVDAHTTIASGTGNYGDVAPPMTPSQILQTGSMGTLTGIEQVPVNGQPSFNYAAGFVAGPAGASADIALYDTNGQMLATLPGAVALAPFQSLETPVSKLFNGIAVPEDAALDVSVMAGSLYTYGRSTLLATSDWALLPSAPIVPYSCPSPAITEFTTSQKTFLRPGMATLSWSSFNADSVTITPDIGTMPPLGSATVNIAASVTYQIQANGVCGQDNASVAIAFGPPQLITISPASGIPGQIVTMTFANLTQPGMVQGAVVTYPDGTSTVVSLTTNAGNRLFAIPLVNGIGGASNGQYAGPVMVSAQFSDGSETASLPFTVNPIVYPGDAVADFSQWFTDMTSQVQSLMAQQSQLPGAADPITALTGSLNDDIATIQQMLTDIAANGSASLASEPGTTDYPNPQPVTVTRADIEGIMTLLNGFNQPSDNAPSNAPSNATADARSPALRPATSATGPCLTDDPLYATCFLIQQIDPNSAWVQSWNAVTGTVADITDIVTSLAKSPAVIVLNKIERIIQKPGFYCNLYPIFLDYFTAMPSPNPVPIGQFGSGNNNAGTIINVNLKPRWTPQQATNQLVMQAQNQLLQNLSKQTKKLGSAGQAAAQQQAAVAMTFLYSKISFDIQNMLAKLGIVQSSKAVKVYACDLEDVYPQGDVPKSAQNPQGASRNPLLARDPSVEPLSSWAYGLYGKRESGLTYLNVQTWPKHFVELTPTSSAKQIRGINGGIYAMPIQVGLGATTLTINSTSVNQSDDAPQLTPPILPVDITVGRTFIVAGKNAFNYSFSTSMMSVDAHVTKQSSTQYQIKLDMSGNAGNPAGVEPGISIAIGIRLRPSPGNSQQVGFSGTATGTCSPSCYIGVSFGYSDNGSVKSIPVNQKLLFGVPPLNQSFNFTSQGPTSASLGIALDAGGVTSQSTFTGTLTLPAR